MSRQAAEQKCSEEDSADREDFFDCQETLERGDQDGRHPKTDLRLQPTDDTSTEPTEDDSDGDSKDFGGEVAEDEHQEEEEEENLTEEEMEVKVVG